VLTNSVSTSGRGGGGSSGGQDIGEEEEVDLVEGVKRRGRQGQQRAEEAKVRSGGGR
jgi:hypothetical protein